MFCTNALCLLALVVATFTVNSPTVRPTATPPHRSPTCLGHIDRMQVAKCAMTTDLGQQLERELSRTVVHPRRGIDSFGNWQPMPR